MEKLIDFESYPMNKALKVLLQDKTTKKNIIWATDPPPNLIGMEYSDRSQITINQIISLPDVIQPRISKFSEEQQERTKKKGEVFTPAWVCNLMNNLCDEEWFEKKDVFNQQEERRWITNKEKIKFPDTKNWTQYVDSRRLEITCGQNGFM